MEHTILVIGTWVFGILGFLGGAPAMMSPMMLDSPGSENKKWLTVVMYAVMTFPIVCLISLPLAWYVYGNFSATYGSAIVFLPLVNILTALVLLTKNK